MELEIIRDYSLEASKRFMDKSLDMVYIDADHSYEMCLLDCELWYEKLRVGGILCGHDFMFMTGGLEYELREEDAKSLGFKIKQGVNLVGERITLNDNRVSSLGIVGGKIEVGFGSTDKCLGNGDVITAVLNFASRLELELEIHWEGSETHPNKGRTLELPVERYEWLIKRSISKI